MARVRGGIVIDACSYEILGGDGLSNIWGMALGLQHCEMSDSRVEHIEV